MSIHASSIVPNEIQPTDGLKLLPRRPLRDMGRIRADLVRDGYAICEAAPWLSESELLAFASVIGSLSLGIDEELSGPPVMHLKYDAAKAVRRDRPAYFSNEAFPLHSDLAYVVNPPRYLFTFCVQPDPRGGGFTSLSDCGQAWRLLSPKQRRELETPQFKFRNPPNTPPGGVDRLPLCLHAAGERIFRYRLDSMTFPDAARDAVTSLDAALKENAISLPLRRGEMMIVDNHRVLHGRTAFEAGGSSQAGRHLLRSYAQDPARSGINAESVRRIARESRASPTA